VANVLIRHRPRTTREYKPCPGELEQRTRLAQLYAAERARIEAACADPLLQRLVLEPFSAVSTQLDAPSSESFINVPAVHAPPYDPVPYARAAADWSLAGLCSLIIIFLFIRWLEIWPLVVALGPFIQCWAWATSRQQQALLRITPQRCLKR
jgi:hypothetical protein